MTLTPKCTFCGRFVSCDNPHYVQLPPANLLALDPPEPVLTCEKCTPTATCNRSACKDNLVNRPIVRIWNDPSRVNGYNDYCYACGMKILRYNQQQEERYFMEYMFIDFPPWLNSITYEKPKHLPPVR